MKERRKEGKKEGRREREEGKERKGNETKRKEKKSRFEVLDKLFQTVFLVVKSRQIGSKSCSFPPLSVLCARKSKEKAAETVDHFRPKTYQLDGRNRLAST